MCFPVFILNSFTANIILQIAPRIDLMASFFFFF